MTHQKQKKAIKLKVDLLSLFPDYFKSPLEQSLLKRALQFGLLEVESHNIRNFASNSYGTIDDTSYGGGPGMVLMPEPVKKAIDHVRTDKSHVIYLSPQGKKLTPSKCKELAQKQHLILLSGHYEGVDERIIQNEVDEEISIGDYIITSGCPAALVLLDATARFIPGVVGDPKSTEQDSFETPLFDHPHYTKPSQFEGNEVPQVLLDGNHQKIEEYRQQASIEKTKNMRPDLYQKWLLQSSQKADLTLFVSDLAKMSQFLKALFPIIKKEDHLLLTLERQTIAFKHGPKSSNCIIQAQVTEQQLQRFISTLEKLQLCYVLGEANNLCFTDPNGLQWIITFS